MTTLSFTAISQSSGEEYDVHASLHEGEFRFTCTCQAGLMGQMCKHRRGLLTGSLASPEVETLREWYAASEAQEVDQAIAQVEAEAARVKKRLSALKAQLGRLLDYGC